MRLKFATIPLLLMIIMQVTSASFPGEPSEQSIESGIAELQKLVAENDDTFFRRREVLSDLARTTFPPKVLEFYTKQLQLGNTEVVHDIANVRGLWSDSFTPLLKDMLVNIDNLSVQENVLQAFDLHSSFPHLGYAFIFEPLNDLGRFSVARLEKDHRQIAFVARLGSPAVLPNLRELLDCHEPVPHPIGLSQPSGTTLPPLRICDCAHDAIVSICRGSLDARIALAYQKINITNQFDPRLIAIPVAATESAVASELDEEVFDPRLRDRKLYAEVLLIRDELIRQLIVDMEN